MLMNMKQRKIEITGNKKYTATVFFQRGGGGGGGGRWGNIKAIFLSKILSISPFLKSNKASFSLRRLTQLELL